MEIFQEVKTERELTIPVVLLLSIPVIVRLSADVAVIREMDFVFRVATHNHHIIVNRTIIPNRIIIHNRVMEDVLLIRHDAHQIVGDVIQMVSGNLTIVAVQVGQPVTVLITQALQAVLPPIHRQPITLNLHIQHILNQVIVLTHSQTIIILREYTVRLFPYVLLFADIAVQQGQTWETILVTSVLGE